MAQNSVQNSSVLYPEDMIAYVAVHSTAYTTLSELSSATWYNIGALTEFSIESANASVQPPSINVEHDQVVTKEADTINMTIQEINSSIVAILRGAVSQQVSTDLSIVGGTSAAGAEILYTGGAETLTPMLLWINSRYSDGRTKSIYYPYVHYVSGGGGSNPKAQGTGEYQDISFTLEARESTSLQYNSRNVFRIELESTAST